MTAEALTGVRASSLAGCIRRAWYQGMDVEEEDLPRRVKKLFRIRSIQNDALALDDAEQARAAGREIVLEQEIPWGPKTDAHPQGIWTAHADFADWTDRVIREYTGSADLAPDRRKMLQSAFYAKRMTEITGVEWGAWVLVFDPSTGEDRFVPINWREIVWEIDIAIADLEAALLARVEPDRINSAGETVCEAPNSGPAMFCPFALHCFRDYSYPTPGRITDPALAAEIAQVRALSDRADVKLIEKDLKPLKQRVAAQLEPKGKYVVADGDGLIEVSYSVIPGRVTISLKEMTDAGFEVPEELLPFVKTGEPSVRLNTKRIEGA